MIPALAIAATAFLSVVPIALGLVVIARSLMDRSAHWIDATLRTAGGLTLLALGPIIGSVLWISAAQALHTIR